MKPITPLIAALVCLVSSGAHADDKADTILKSVRERMQRMETYSVCLQFLVDNKARVSVRIISQHPDKKDKKFVFGLSNSNGEEITIVINGRTVAARDKKAILPLRTPEGRDMVDTFLPIISGEFRKIFFKKITDTKYIEYKVLDEIFRVDVIDIIGESPNDKIRVYVDNDSLIRRIVGSSKGRSISIRFDDIETDLPLPDDTFTIK